MPATGPGLVDCADRSGGEAPELFRAYKQKLRRKKGRERKHTKRQKPGVVNAASWIVFMLYNYIRKLDGISYSFGECLFFRTLLFIFTVFLHSPCTRFVMPQKKKRKKKNRECTIHRQFTSEVVILTSSIAPRNSSQLARWTRWKIEKSFRPLKRAASAYLFLETDV